MDAVLGEMRVFLQEVDDHFSTGDLASLSAEQSLRRRGEILLCQLAHTAVAADEVVNSFIPVVTALRGRVYDDVDSYQAPISVFGDRGRPRYHISRGQLQYLLKLGFRIPDIAVMLEVSQRTAFF